MPSTEDQKYLYQGITWFFRTLVTEKILHISGRVRENVGRMHHMGSMRNQMALDFSIATLEEDTEEMLQIL